MYRSRPPERLLLPQVTALILPKRHEFMHLSQTLHRHPVSAKNNISPQVAQVILGASINGLICRQISPTERRNHCICDASIPSCLPPDSNYIKNLITSSYDPHFRLPDTTDVGVVTIHNIYRCKAQSGNSEIVSPLYKVFSMECTAFRGF